MPGPVSRPTGPIAPGQSNMVGQLAHWMLYGSAPGGGLSSVPGQAAAIFNPLHPQGLANLASMFIGGAKDSPLDDQSWLEPYQLAKSVPSGQVVFKEGQPWDVKANVQSSKLTPNDYYGGINNPYNVIAANHYSLQALKNLHDILFGGTVHATGPIPPRP